MKLHRLFAALAIALCPFSAKADQFNFSYAFDSGEYAFDSGDIVTGSLFGTQNGLYVESISNVSVSLNGTLFSGSPNLSLFGWIPNCCFTTAIPPLVSFDGNLNNFGFSNGSSVNFGDNDSWFAIQAVNDNRQAAVQMGSFGTADNDANGRFDASHWVLTPVPEPETYALMLAGLGILGFAARRRKRKEAVAA